MSHLERNLAADKACIGQGGGYDVRVQYAGSSLRPHKFPIGTKPLPTESFEQIMNRLRAETRIHRSAIVAVESWRVCQRSHTIGQIHSRAGRSRLERQFAGFVADESKLVEIKPGVVDEEEYGISRSATLRHAVGSFASGTRVVLLSATPFERDNFPIRLLGPAAASTFQRPVLVGLRTGSETMLRQI